MALGNISIALLPLSFALVYIWFTRNISVLLLFIYICILAKIIESTISSPFLHTGIVGLMPVAMGYHQVPTIL